MSAPDLTDLPGPDLDDLRLSVLAELDRRARIEQAPQAIATAVQDAARVGIPGDTILEVVNTAMEVI